MLNILHPYKIIIISHLKIYVFIPDSLIIIIYFIKVIFLWVIQQKSIFFFSFMQLLFGCFINYRTKRNEKLAEHVELGYIPGDMVNQ